eukprot:TRINITY_DN8155_c0_g1_i1.p1 TRINITY_DN8155_c0_g1~~TRINITY_DN8155_c0_g1_i1.p1  ORF type:complete len:2256 (+),score=530.17 TRINITY_DN8155_c0_g1_i1:623-6769(+)
MAGPAFIVDILESVTELREYDVPYYVRVSIDSEIRVGYWYIVTPHPGGMDVKRKIEWEHRADPRVLAFDIETTHLPLKFPTSATDQIMMISYMIDGRGFLIVNRELVSDDIADFEYTPKPEYPGLFECFNEVNEKELLLRFFEHIKMLKPNIIVTYNGDSFDFPFVCDRAWLRGIHMEKEIGFSKNQAGEFSCRFASHMDAFRWVKRDSYLPAGSHGLKAVTRSKLGYDPLELDPEDMVKFAATKPQELASYSVSDAVATYYLYMKYVHPFVFSLCTIIPMCPDDVLRKGSGTLCEQLLMVEAFRNNIICQNKFEQDTGKFYNGHPLESETYNGGHVEAIESGVFRANIPMKFNLNPDRLDELIGLVDEHLRFAIEMEGKISLEGIEDVRTIAPNYDDVRDQILAALYKLRDTPRRLETPLIYHLDVAAMYPNIILTNRLQPVAIVNEQICAGCDFNRPESNCKREMNWMHRAEYYPISRNEYEHIKTQLESERVPSKKPDEQARMFYELGDEEQQKLLKQRITDYSRKTYKKVHIKEIAPRTSTICQRENPFYVDTVRLFRDRRYEFKDKLKVWQRNEKEAQQSGDANAIVFAKGMLVLYDSLQLAHKCILNSFYGYVMRKGARWYSMEMAGVVTHTGSNIIKEALQLVQDLGRPLELDTDGIWCTLPTTFPESFSLKLKGQAVPALTISYPCTMLNAVTHKLFSNDQYQQLVDKERHEYQTSKECSIFFEVDGPYLAMVLPAAKEEGKKLKKRYAVFKFDGTLAELKGFEVKRRGELKLIKNFQVEVFGAFLRGDSLETCYGSVAAVADHYLDLLESRGEDLDDEELLELISESSTMSRVLTEYGEQKSCAITTARRLAEFLGDEMVKSAGLACHYIVSKKPDGLQVTERAIPIAIFHAEEPIKRQFLRKWVKDSSLTDFDIRQILDWDYYRGRIASAIQKIITIPAALQSVANPVPRVLHPDWLRARLAKKSDRTVQQRLNHIFSAAAPETRFEIAPETPPQDHDMMDIEDIASKPHKPVIRSKRKPMAKKQDDQDILTLSQDGLRALGPVPDVENDFEDWLLYEKKKWRLLRAVRKRRKMLGGESVPTPAASLVTSHGLRGYLKDVAETTKAKMWQIVQISSLPDAAPGLFRAWALIGTQLHAITVSIPRVFYINSRVPDDEDSAQSQFRTRVIKTLPRSHQCLNLYEYSMDEQLFQENAKFVSKFMTHAEVEGVYEMNVPLLFRAVCELGCAVSVNKEGRYNDLKDLYHMKMLDPRSPAEADYFRNGIQHLFFYHLYDARNPLPRQRAVFAVFAPADKKAWVIIANPFAEQTREMRKPLENHLEVHCPDETFEVEYIYVRSTKNASGNVTAVQNGYKAVSRVLQTYHETHDMLATMLVSQSALTAVQMHTEIAASDLFPIVTIPTNETDNVMGMSWQAQAAALIVQRYLGHEQWLENALDLARFANIPIGNLTSDHAMFIIDVLMARNLHANNHLLWISNTGRPDLGGAEEDDNSFADEPAAPELVNKGSYKCVCVELEVASLAVSSVLVSHRINDVEGALGIEQAAANAVVVRDVGGAVAAPGSLAASIAHAGPAQVPAAASSSLVVVDDALASAPAFRAIKQLVTRWVQETARDNPHADMLLTHLYRWIRSSASRLHDPAIHKLIHSMMRKLFLQLVHQMKRFGATIVYASFNKIILATNKSSLSNAHDYVKFLVDTIGSRDLFTYVSLQPSQSYLNLVFMDSANFGGVRPLTDEAIPSQRDSISQRHTESQPFADMSGQKHVIDSFWNIARYLPPSIQETLEVQLSEFILQLFRIREAHNPLVATNKKETAESEEQAIRQLISQYFQSKLLKIVPEMRMFLKSSADTAFPVLPGNHLNMVDPALEFVKMLCVVFNLEGGIEKEVALVRRQLLKQLDVREFSSEAEFRNPCLSHTLHDVVCSFCNSVRDLDLCRDIYLLDEKWECPHCGHPYNKISVENDLVQSVRRRMLAYQLQDIVCDKCRNVKADNLSPQCTCSGVWVNRESRDAFMQKLNVFASIADYYKFEFLENVVSWSQSSQVM